MKTRIIGTGNMGRSLGRSWALAGHEVFLASGAWRKLRKRQVVQFTTIGIGRRRNSLLYRRRGVGAISHD